LNAAPFEKGIGMPRFSWKLGRLAGIDLYLHPTFLLLLLPVFGWVQSIESLVLVLSVFGCVVLHELGHALMARRYGIQTRDITPYPIGGVASLERMPRSAGPELLIALAGPAVNLAIAAGLWLVTSFVPFAPESVLFEFALTLMVINVQLLVFNMLPIFP